MPVSPGQVKDSIGTPDLTARLKRASERVVDQHTGGVLTGALAKWPVNTGASRDEIVLQVQNSSPERVVRLIGIVGKTVAYARFIRSTKVGTVKNATLRRAVYTAHIRLPTLAARKAIVKELPKAIVDEVKRGS